MKSVHEKTVVEKVALDSSFFFPKHSFVRIILPVISTHLRLSINLNRRTSGRSLVTLKESKSAFNIEKNETKMYFRVICQRLISQAVLRVHNKEY